MTFVLSEDHESLEQLLEDRAPAEPEFQQAVLEVSNDIIPIIHQSELYKKHNILQRLIEPEKVISFKVCWEDDSGSVQVNRGYRVQFNSVIGPYKGGLRFSPSVTPSVLKFLAFEQTFKNALTGLPMGGGKGGADFDPSGRSDREIMRFCNAFMQQLHSHIGAQQDIPAGDINVGDREIGYLFGAYKRITGQFDAALTGKPLSLGGSELRTEATGYGVVYFLQQMLEAHNMNLEGSRVLISGAGNVATHTAQKAIDLGATVLSVSDSTGCLHDANGFSTEKIALIRQLKADPGKSLKQYVDYFDADWQRDTTPWQIDADIAIPCATQNEMDEVSVKQLIDSNVKVLLEGANMPLTSKAQQQIQQSNVLYAPGKAANAGGVAVSGFEISQDRTRKFLSADKIDSQLRTTMAQIHDRCASEGLRDGKINYAKGANIAAFRKIADAMVALGY